MISTEVKKLKEFLGDSIPERFKQELSDDTNLEILLLLSNQLSKGIANEVYTVLNSPLLSEEMRVIACLSVLTKHVSYFLKCYPDKLKSFFKNIERDIKSED